MTIEKLKDLESLNEIEFSDSQREGMIEDFSFMESKEKELSSFDTKNVEPMVYVLEMTNVLREDVRKQPFTRESLLECGPEHTEDSWQVPRLVK